MAVYCAFDKPMDASEMPLTCSSTANFPVDFVFNSFTTLLLRLRHCGFAASARALAPLQLAMASALLAAVLLFAALVLGWIGSVLNAPPNGTTDFSFAAWRPCGPARPHSLPCVLAMVLAASSMLARDLQDMCYRLV